MAGDWIPMRTDLAEDPAVIGIADATGLDECGVVGRLHRLWSWASWHTEDGDIRGVTLSWVNRHVQSDGFAEAMEKVGWLITTKNGIRFPKFEEWNSQSAKKRRLTAKRVALHRENISNASGVTKTLPEKRREESVREQNIKDPPPRPPGKRSAPAAATVQAKPEGDGGGRRDSAERMPDRFAEAFEAVKACGVRLAHDAVMIALRNGFSIDGILAVVDVFHAEPGKWTEGALHERLTAAGMAEFAAHEGWVSPSPDWQKRQPKPRAKPVDLPTADLPSPLEPIYGDRLDRMTDQQIADLVRDSPRFTLRDKADAPRFGKSVKELRAKLLAAIQDGDMANGC